VLDARIAMSQDRSIFSPGAYLKQRVARFTAVRTPASRQVFLKLIENLAKLDNRSTPDNDNFGDFAVAHFLFEIEGRPGCVYTLLKAFFWFGSEFPARLRKRLSPRVDLTGALTFSDAAKVLYSALREASMPVMIDAFGERDTANWQDWKPRNNESFSPPPTTVSARKRFCASL
jgi:hypothetical protein